MKKILFAAMGLIAFAVIFFLIVVHEIHTEGPAETVIFEFDVPLRDDHIIAVTATVDYHQTDEEVIFSPEEIEDRIYSNLLVAFGLATKGAEIKDVQGVFDEDSLQGEIEESIAFYNSSPYEVVKVDSFKLSFEFDPPAEDFEELPSFKEGSLEEIEPQQPLNLSMRGVMFPI